ncbi:MAG: 16S rRNA (cytidine(1402)-2'-O)-methyltransferase [Actinobacteria bacterium]|nr:16S rRNA (cytidine(1402)-2'-O)-methyltransferase [Actinomycetota bacterium]
MAGKLSMVATPIGNLADISRRALDVLNAADTILAEDTRVTSKLLSHYKISTRIERCDENTIFARTPVLLERMDAGETFAFCSDAGTPGVSDPGAYLVAAAHAHDLEVEVIPGASAVTTAYVASGFAAPSFYFGGFLPRKAGEREKLFSTLKTLDAALIFYESPHRCVASLKAIAEAFPTREACMARELTKLHEEVLRGKAASLVEQLTSREGSLKGEVVLLIGPPTKEETFVAPGGDEVVSRIRELLTSGMSKSAAVKQVASEFGVSKNSLYDVVHGMGE